MPLQGKIGRIAFLSSLLAAVLILGFIERSIPLSLAIPGVRPGLANAVILVALYLLPWREGFLLVVLKCLLTALLFGNWLSLLYSVAGSFLSFFMMLLILRRFREAVSAIGVSVVGALCHNAGQLLAASMVMGSFAVMVHLPLLILSGTVTGIVVGIAAGSTLPYITKFLAQGDAKKQ